MSDEAHGAQPHEIPEPAVKERQEVRLEDIDFEKMEADTAKLRLANGRGVAQLEKYGVTLQDVGPARHELFIKMMVEYGLIPREFYLMFDLRWEREMQAMLTPALAQATGQRLVIPGKNSPHVKMPPRG